MVINNNKILYLLCQLIRPLIYIVYNTTYKLYINSGDVMLIFLGGGRTCLQNQAIFTIIRMGC